MYKHILIATDGSDLAAKAVATGLALAKQLGAKVTAVTATEPWDSDDDGRAGHRLPDRRVRGSGGTERGSHSGERQRGGKEGRCRLRNPAVP